jgi:hypothetical protein
MALQQHRSRHPVDALPPLIALDTARDEGALGRRRRQPLVDQFHRQPGFMLYRGRQTPCGGCFRTPRAVQAQRQTDDDPRRLVRASNLSQPARQGLPGLRGDGRKRLRDGLGRVAQGQPDALRSGIDGEDSQRYGDGFDDGLGVVDGVVVGGGAFDSTT